MDESTKKIVDLVIKFSTVANLKGNFVISKPNRKFVGIDIRFEPALNLSDFPSIERVMEILNK